MKGWKETKKKCCPSREAWGYKTEMEGRIESGKRVRAPRKKGEGGRKTDLHGPMDLEKTRKLRFRVGGPAGPAKKKEEVY